VKLKALLAPSVVVMHATTMLSRLRSWRRMYSYSREKSLVHSKILRMRR